MEAGVYCIQQAVDGWSHSAEHIEQPMVPSTVSLVSFVVHRTVMSPACAVHYQGSTFDTFHQVFSEFLKVRGADFKSMHILRSAFVTVMAAKRSRL